MDLDKFTKLVTDPARSMNELRGMFENARSKGARDHAAIAKLELDRRFPGWDVIKSRRGGAKPTIVTFKGKERHFSTSRDAYVWLIERFADALPRIFEDPSEDMIYIAVGRQRNYFGRNLEKMFHATPELASNPSNYVRLKDGWYANLNLSNVQKFEVLLRFGAIAHLAYPTQWDWKVLDPTEALIDMQAATTRAKELLEELKSFGQEH